MKTLTCIALLLCGAILPVQPTAQDASAESSATPERFFLGGALPVRGFEFEGTVPVRGFDIRVGTELLELPVDASAQGPEDLRARRAEIQARLERLELESELARMEREHEQRRNVRSARNELQAGIMELDERREDLEHRYEQQEEDSQERWEELEHASSSRRERLDEEMSALIEEENTRFELERIEARKTIENDEAIEAFDVRTELEWNQRERALYEKQREVMAEIETEYAEGRRGLRAAWRGAQDELRGERRSVERHRQEFEQRLEELEEESETQREISELRAQAEVLEAKRILEAELERIELALEQSEYDEASEEEESSKDCEEADDQDEEYEEEEEEEAEEEGEHELVQWLRSDGEVSGLLELREAVRELREEVDALREEVDALWEAVREREDEDEDDGEEVGASMLRRLMDDENLREQIRTSMIEHREAMQRNQER